MAAQSLYIDSGTLYIALLSLWLYTAGIIITKQNYSNRRATYTRVSLIPRPSCL